MIKFSLASFLDKIPIKINEDGHLTGVDKCTGVLETIAYPHHEIHAGSAFSASLGDTDFDKSDTLNICFTTPDSKKFVHMLVVPSCTVPSLFEILEAPTITNGSGTPQIIYNRNRNSSKTSGIKDITVGESSNTVSENCTVAADGIPIYQEALGGGKNARVDAGVRASNEWILKRNTDYAFRIAGAGITDNGTGSMVLTWYEHQDKE